MALGRVESDFGLESWRQKKVELRRMLLKFEQCETETLNSTEEATTTRKSFFAASLLYKKKH